MQTTFMNNRRQF